ncbi:ParB/RepB/Spo0J family partition protein (plasmid) [Myxococcus stipitatus]|uniref:ParB/RepB/Spo0J family partition protein n=1 Tax=Myxococcus stipitatus TaxID=83455 RepID=UPI0031450464
MPTAVVAIEVPLSDISEGNNTRSVYDEAPLAELAASIASHGVQQPILLRMHDDGKLTVAAGFRRFRASFLAGRTTIPATIRTLTDAEALELNLIENLQRADPHPLDEADGFHSLQTAYRYTLADISAKTSKTPAYISRRLQLINLGEPARAAYRARKILDSVAVLIATLRDEVSQAAAVAHLTRDVDPIGLAAAREYIDAHHRLNLKDAPFSTTDAKLVAGVPSCNACPKRSGNALHLFEASPTDLCSDRSCFMTKADATWTQTAEKALAKGHEVLDDAEASTLFSYGTHLPRGSPYLSLTSTCWDDELSRTWEELLAPFHPPIVIARNRELEVVRLVRVEDAQPIIQHLGLAEAASDSSAATPPQSWTPEDAKKREQELKKERRTRKAVVDQALHSVAERAAAEGPTDAVLRFLAAEALSSVSFDTARLVSQLRGFTGTSSECFAGLASSVAALSGAQALGLLSQVLSARWAHSPHVGLHPPALERAAETLAIDLQQIRAEVEAAPQKRAKKAA